MRNVKGYLPGIALLLFLSCQTADVNEPERIIDSLHLCSDSIPTTDCRLYYTSSIKDLSGTKDFAVFCYVTREGSAKDIPAVMIYQKKNSSYKFVQGIDGRLGSVTGNITNGCCDLIIEQPGSSGQMQKAIYKWNGKSFDEQ